MHNQLLIVNGVEVTCRLIPIYFLRSIIMNVISRLRTLRNSEHSNLVPGIPEEIQNIDLIAKK